VYGSLKQHQWEPEYTAHFHLDGAPLGEPAPQPGVAEVSAGDRLQLVHNEATVLLARLEELREIVAAHEAAELLVAAR
jgi:hypothetical protein